MNIFGKTIRLFLLEGTTNSLVTAELSNWTGIGIRVPKIKVKEYSNRQEFQKQGVYILIGKGENNEDAAYIGEAEVVYERLLSHISHKEFWNEVVFFCSKDKYLNKASIKYLENRMHELAITAGRYKIDQNIPTRSELSEAEQAELEEFLANIKTLTAALGYKIFEGIEETLKDTIKVLPSIEKISGIETQVFYCKNSTGIIASGQPSTEGFVVFKDSCFLKDSHQSMHESIRVERSKMLTDGTLILVENAYKLTKHYVFNSPSRAASMVLGRSARGTTEWKTDKGEELRVFGM